MVPLESDIKGMFTGPSPPCFLSALIHAGWQEVEKSTETSITWQSWVSFKITYFRLHWAFIARGFASCSGRGCFPAGPQASVTEVSLVEEHRLWVQALVAVACEASVEVVWPWLHFLKVWLDLSWTRGSNPCPLLWQADFNHCNAQERPVLRFFQFFCPITELNDLHGVQRWSQVEERRTSIFFSVAQR